MPEKGDVNVLFLGMDKGSIWTADTIPSSFGEYSTVELFVEGNILIEEEFWHEAERLWAYAVHTHPKNRAFKYRWGLCLLELGEDWEKVKEVLTEVTTGDLTLYYNPFDAKQRIPPLEAWLWLATAEHRLLEFDEAKKHVKKFIARAGDKHPMLELASNILNEIRFAEKQMEGKPVASVAATSFNSDAQESHPVITADGHTLFFSSTRSRKNGTNHGRQDKNTHQHYFDIYQSNMLQDSTWSEPVMVNAGLLDHAHVVGSDAFGEKLVVLSDDGWQQELMVTERWERGWTKATLLNLDRSIPLSGEVVFFPSKDRVVVSAKLRRGEGGYDLYESHINGRGKWTRLKPIGEDRVNTWADEVSPFVAADGKTIFFASNGLEGMGGFDLFKTSLNAAGGWTTPENLGWPVNSVGDELAFVVGAKGEQGYFASRRKASGGDLDIFEAIFPGKNLLEEDVVVFTVDASEIARGDMPANMVIRDAATNEVLVRSDKSFGGDSFHFILPEGREFVVEAISEDGQVAVMDESATLLSRAITLPDEGEADVVDVPFDDFFVFNSEKSETTTSSEMETTEDEPFLVTSKWNWVEPVAEVVDEELEPSEEGGEASGEEEDLADASTTESTEATEAGDATTGVAASASPSDMLHHSAPICPLALAEVNAGQPLMAIQLYSGQVATGRMKLGPVVDHLVGKAAQGKLVLRVEGSASDTPSSLPGGNERLAGMRASDVVIRLRSELTALGLQEGTNFEFVKVIRVQPDGDTPEAYRQGANPASFQYVRLDLRIL